MPKTQRPSAGPAKYLLTVGALAVCYFAAAKAGLAFAIPPGNATAVWPASGIALAALLLLGFRVWPGIWLGAAIANLTTGVSLFTAISMGGGNTLAAILGAWLFCRFLPMDAPFAKVRDAFVFAAVAAVACMVAAGIGASSLLIGGDLEWPQFAANLSTWWLGDVAGQIIVVPLVLACVGRRWRVRTKPQWAELALYFVLLGVVSQCIFGGWFPERLAENVLYVPMILLIWASLRFGLVEVTLGTALLSVVAIWGTCSGVGAYSTEALQESLFDLQVFMNTYAITALAVVGLAAGRRVAEQALIESTASFEAVFNSAPVMMVLLDKNRNVRAANAAAAEVLTGANSELTDQRYGHAVQCVHTLNEPQGCEGKGACGSCGVRRIIDGAFETSTACRAEEVCLTRKVDGMVQDRYFLISTSLPQIPAKQEVLVCLEDITERKRTEEQVRTNLRMQKVINGILQSSLETASQVEFLQETLDLLISIPWLAVQRKGSVFLKDEDSETLNMVAHRGLPDELLAACRTLPFGKCVCGRAAASREILFVGEVDDRHEVRYPGMAAHGHYCVPIASEDRLYGVLNLYVDAGHQRVVEEEAFLASVASVLAITVRRKEAEKALRYSEQRFDLAVRGTDAGIWDWDTRSNKVYFSPRWKGMLGYEEEELSDDFSQWNNRLHPDDRERALTTVQDYLEGRTTEYELEHRLRHKDGTYRWILARGAAVRDATGKAYRMVGSHLDITSLKKAEHALREKEAELIAAAEIQNFLLPQQSVSVPGFSIAGRCYPTQVAAGDYFDYLWLPDGSFLIVLGDVTGHGLGPAIVTAAAHARFRALSENHSDLTQIALRANAALHRNTRDDMFLTLIAGRIDLKSRELTYFNAGHPPAQVLDSAGDVKARLKPTSMPLAIQRELECETGARVPLEDHDVILFFTDGLVEAQPATGPPFGIDRALQVVRDNSGRCAAEIIETLHAAVCQHTGTKKLHDDLTLVVVKVDSLRGEIKE